MPKKGQLVMFWGSECPHCHVMMPLVERLEREEGVKFKKLEVWHNEANARKMRAIADIIKSACGGVFGTPTFYDPERAAALCGEQPYELLREWAFGGPKTQSRTQRQE